MQSAAYYLTPPTEVGELGLAVTGVGRITGKDSPIVNRALTGHAGVLVAEGSGRLALHGRAGHHEVRVGSFFWLPPGVPHTYGPGPGTWTEYWVLFEGPAAGRYEDLGYLSAGAAVVRPAEPERATAALELLLDIAGRPESTAQHVAAGAALHSLICAVGSAGPPPTGGRRGTGREIGRRALAILTRDAAGPVSIEAVARELSVSRDTLATEVRRLTGSTPSDYLMRLRLSRAKTLLAGSDRPVAQVAREVGYDDPAYFARVFARRVGVPPTVFRQQQTGCVPSDGTAVDPTRPGLGRWSAVAIEDSPRSP